MSRRVGFLVAAPMLAAAAVLMPQLVTATHSVPSTIEDTELQALAEETNEDEAIDLYGNQVTAAVATYEFDATGTPYERHSPQTLLPRLGSPKS